MTRLIEFPAGIDTLERRLVATASLLGGVTTDSEGTELIPKAKVNEAIKIGWELKKKTGGVIEPTMIIEVSIYYNAAQYKELSGNLLASLLTYGDAIPNEPDDIEPSDSFAELPSIPEEVLSLEHLFVSDAFILAASTFPNYSYIKFQPFQAESPPRLFTTISLPFNYQVYCLTQDFTQAVEDVVDEYILSIDDLL